MLLTWDQTEKDLDEKDVKSIQRKSGYTIINLKVRVPNSRVFIYQNALMSTKINSFSILVGNVTRILGYNHVSYHIVKFMGKRSLLFPYASLVKSTDKNLTDLLCIQLLCGVKRVNPKTIFVTSSGNYLNLCHTMIEEKLFGNIVEDCVDRVGDRISNFVSEKVLPLLDRVLTETADFIDLYPELAGWRNAFTRRVNTYIK